MTREYVITMTAANRSGILSAVTKAMTELGADLRECSQTVVRGFFTMIISAEFPDAMESGIIRDHLLDVCRPFGIEVGVNDPARILNTDSAGSSRRMHLLRLGGRNQPGALRKLSAVIAMRRVDITGMHAVRTPDGDGFEIVMKIAVPVECGVRDLERDLQAAGTDFQATADISDLSV